MAKAIAPMFAVEAQRAGFPYALNLTAEKAVEINFQDNKPATQWYARSGIESLT